MSTSVFVLKPSSLGDIVHTLPAVAWMKRARPDWRFTWMVNTEWAPLLAGNPTVDEVLLFPRREFLGVTGLLPFRRWVNSRVRQLRPDLAVDFQGLLRTAGIARLSGARVVHGLNDAREGARWLYDRVARVPGGVPHAIERYLALASEVLDGLEQPPALEYPLPPGVQPNGAGDYAGGGYVLIHPFSRGAGKSLTVQQVQQLCEGLAPRRRVVLAGRTGHELSGCFNRRYKSFLDATSLDELIWLIRRADFVISVDSGPMHLAAALGRPLVSVHTWSDPRKVGPYRDDAGVWKGGRLFTFAERHALSDAFYRQSPMPIESGDLDAITQLALSI